MIRWVASASIALMVCAPSVGAAPLDDWLIAAAGRDTVIAAPRMQAVFDPLGRAVERLRSHPVIGEATAPGVADLVAGLGFDPFERDAAAKIGLDPTGPLVLADGPQGGLAVVAVADVEKAGRWLRAATDAQPATVAGRTGWRWDAGVAVFADGALFAARNEADIKRLWVTGADAPDPIGHCPVGRGGADVYVLLRQAAGAGCVTARVDPGRVRLDARIKATDMTPSGWLKPGAGLPDLRRDPAMAIGIDPGPALSAVLSAGLDPARAPFVGPIALTLGPGALDVLFAMHPADPTILERFVKAASGRDDVILDPPRGGLRRIAVKPVDGQPLPPVKEVWLGTAHGRTWIATDRAPIDAGPQGSPSTGLSPDLFTGAGLTVYLRPGGLPHDGGPWADAVAPRLTALGIDMSGLRQFAGTFAWIWAHFGEIGLAVSTPDATHWRFALEVVTL